MTRPAFALVAAVVAGLAAPAASAQTAPERIIAGVVAYLPRIALPEGAEVVVEAVRPDGALAGESRTPTAGRQVPLPFALAVAADTPVTLRVGVAVEGRLAWLTAGRRVPAGAVRVDLGDLRLHPHVPMGMASVLRCGERVVEVGFVDDGARLREGLAPEVAGEAADLRPVIDLALVPAASGARYATPDDATWVWSKGDAVSIQIDGVALPECVAAPAPLALPITARGTEPFWSVTVGPERMTFAPMDGVGAVDAATPLPRGLPEAGGWRYVPFGADLAVTLRAEVCRDAMTGMPHPAAATVETGGRVLTGCAGAPADLLAGPEWTVSHVAEAPVPADAAVSIAFDIAQSSVSGASGCNRYVGGFTLSGEGLSLAGPMAGTMMACEDAKMALESEFRAALEQVDRFDLDPDGALVLLGADRPLIRARR